MNSKINRSMPASTALPVSTNQDTIPNEVVQNLKLLKMQAQQDPLQREAYENAWLKAQEECIKDPSKNGDIQLYNMGERFYEKKDRFAFYVMGYNAELHGDLCTAEDYYKWALEKSVPKAKEALERVRGKRMAQSARQSIQSMPPQPSDIELTWDTAIGLFSDIPSAPLHSARAELARSNPDTSKVTAKVKNSRWAKQFRKALTAVPNADPRIERHAEEELRRRMTSEFLEHLANPKSKGQETILISCCVANFRSERMFLPREDVLGTMAAATHPTPPSKEIKRAAKKAKRQARRAQEAAARQAKREAKAKEEARAKKQALIEQVTSSLMATKGRLRAKRGEYSMQEKSFSYSVSAFDDIKKKLDEETGRIRELSERQSAIQETLLEMTDCEAPVDAFKNLELLLKRILKSNKKRLRFLEEIKAKKTELETESGKLEKARAQLEMAKNAFKTAKEECLKLGIAIEKRTPATPEQRYSGVVNVGGSGNLKSATKAEHRSAAKALEAKTKAKALKNHAIDPRKAAREAQASSPEKSEIPSVKTPRFLISQKWQDRIAGLMSDDWKNQGWTRKECAVFASHFTKHNGEGLISYEINKGKGGHQELNFSGLLNKYSEFYHNLIPNGHERGALGRITLPDSGDGDMLHFADMKNLGHILRKLGFSEGHMESPNGSPRSSDSDEDKQELAA